MVIESQFVLDERKKARQTPREVILEVAALLNLDIPDDYVFVDEDPLYKQSPRSVLVYKESDFVSRGIPFNEGVDPRDLVQRFIPFSILAYNISANPDEDQGQMGALGVLMAMGLFQMDGGAAVNSSYEIVLD